jgi:hypothetical protein
MASGIASSVAINRTSGSGPDNFSDGLGGFIV